RALVAIENAFVVARGYQWGVALPIGHDDERELVAFQSLFQEDAFPSGAKVVLFHHALNESARFVEILRDQNALAGAQAIRFDHQRKSDLAQGVISFLRGFERTVHFRRGNVVSLQELFRENLTAFELRRNIPTAKMYGAFE